MKKFFQIVFVMFVFAIFSSTAANANGNYIEEEGLVNYEKGMNPNVMRRIAILDAYRRLAERIDTIHVTVNSTVRNMRDLDETINAKVETTLRGAEVISSTRQKDGSFRAVVRLNMYGGAQSLAGAVLNENIPVEDFLEPRYVNTRTEVSYTGIIIDCRGLKLSIAIAPAIKSVGGREIYSYKNIGYQKATTNGMVEYADSMDSPRAGSSPLVIKALQLSGSCDVVVSDDDADKILTANQMTNVLSNCAVVFVR